MFKDVIKLKFQAGKGGDGGVSFGRNRKPDGGIGGNGGSIYLEGTTNLFDFRNFTQNRLYKATDGERGGRGNQTGKDGKDIVLKVPLATNVYDQSNKPILNISKEGEKKILVKGGLGGAGNYKFRGGGLKNLKKYKEGEAGEKIATLCELELISDVIFIGMPNVGKSSILKVLSEAKPKIADYAFTTLTPQLGMAKGVTMMDLPGLIEGTFEGKGLGTDFIKHTRRSKFIAHYVNLASKDPLKDYQAIRKELKNIDKKLAAKPELLILTKSDEVDQMNINNIELEFAKYFKKKKKKILGTIIVSVLDDVSVKNLFRTFKKICKQN